jgi:NADH-quinone oxidoreductase subunit H
MDSTIIIEKVSLLLQFFALTMLMAMYSTWAERKALSFKIVLDQIELVLSIVSTACRWFKIILSKEEFEPNTPNRFLFFGPAIAMSTALMTSAVPWGDKLHLFGRDILLQATDLNIGCYTFGVVSVGVYGIMIGGGLTINFR